MHAIIAAHRPAPVEKAVPLPGASLSPIPAMPDYKFLVFNTEGEQANRAVRSHAMRTALQLRSEGTSTSTSSASSTSLLIAQSRANLKGRFRLPSRKTMVKSDKHKDLSESIEESGIDDEEAVFKESMAIVDPWVPPNYSSGTVRTGTPVITFANTP